MTTSETFTPCTVWLRRTPVSDWEHNHLEYGHAEGSKPTPKFPSQVGWLTGEWTKYHAWLTPDAPPKVVYYSEE